MIRLYKTDIPYKFIQEPKKKKSRSKKRKSGSKNESVDVFGMEQIGAVGKIFESFRKKWIITELNRVIVSVAAFTSGGIITFSKIGSSPKRDKYFNVSITKVKGKPIISYNGKSGSIDDVVLRLYKDGADSIYTVRCMSNIKSFSDENDYLKDRKKNIIMSFAKAMKGANGFFGNVHTNRSGTLIFDGKSTYKYNKKIIAKSEKEFVEWGIQNISLFSFPNTAFGYGLDEKLKDLNKIFKCLERMSIPTILMASIEARKNASVEQQDAFLQKQTVSQPQKGEDRYFFSSPVFANPRSEIDGSKISDRQLIFISEKGVEKFMREVKKLTSLGFLNKKAYFIYQVA